MTTFSLDPYLMNDLKKAMDDISREISAAGDKNDNSLGNINKTLRQINAALRELVAATDRVTAAIEGDAARFKAASDPHPTVNIPSINEALIK